MTNKSFTGVRHGEVALIPIKEIPKNARVTETPGDYILAHSETGHNHVLEGKQFEVLEDPDNRVFIRIFGNTKLAHRKTYDQHNTLTLPPALAERYEMVEYNPASEAIQVVRD